MFKTNRVIYTVCLIRKGLQDKPRGINSGKTERRLFEVLISCYKNACVSALTLAVEHSPTMLNNNKISVRYIPVCPNGAVALRWHLVISKYLFGQQ